MAIKVKILGGGEISGVRVKTYPACDYCGSAITKDKPGNIEYDNKEGAEVFFLHKECSKMFREGKPLRLWSELDKVTIHAH